MMGNLTANRLLQLSSALDKWVHDLDKQNRLGLTSFKTTEVTKKTVPAEKPRWQREYEMWAKKNPGHRKLHNRHEWEKIKRAQLASSEVRVSEASEQHPMIEQDTSTSPSLDTPIL